MSEYCIELNEVTKKFGHFTAVDKVSLKLEPGKIYGFVGPNGAGKSTTMAMIMGSLFPTSGSGKVFDHPLASTAALKDLGYSPEFTSFYRDMSCAEYLHYMGRLSGLSDKEAVERTKELLDKFELNEHANRRVAKFSTGMKKKVSLAQAMINHPKVLLLDEPTANLDPTSRQEILDTVRDMVENEKLTVLISSHVLTELETVISHVIMISHGKIILDAPIHEAQEMFKKGILIVNTNDNDTVYEALKDHYQCTVIDEGLRFMAENMEQLKKDIVTLAYTKGLILNLLQEEVMSLDALYKHIMEGNNHESDNKENA